MRNDDIEDDASLRDSRKDPSKTRFRTRFACSTPPALSTTSDVSGFVASFSERLNKFAMFVRKSLSSPLPDHIGPSPDCSALQAGGCATAPTLMTRAGESMIEPAQVGYAR